MYISCDVWKNNKYHLKLNGITVTRSPDIQTFWDSIFTLFIYIGENIENAPFHDLSMFWTWNSLGSKINTSCPLLSLLHHVHGATSSVPQSDIRPRRIGMGKIIVSIHRQSPILLLLTKNFLLVILCKYGNFSSFLNSLLPFQ